MADDDLYELAEPGPSEPAPRPAKHRAVPPTLANAPGVSAAAGATKPATPAGLGKSAVERALEAREDEVKPSHVRNVVLPGALLAVGFVGQLIGWWEIGKTASDGATLIIAAVALQLAVMLPLSLLSVATIAKWFELGLGSLPGVLWKLLALMLGTGGVGDVFFMLVVTLQDFEPSTVVAGYGIYLVLVGVPSMILFEFNPYEMALAVLLFFLPRMAAIVTAALMFEEMFR